MCETEKTVNMSNDIGEVAKALSEAQAEFDPIKKSATNPFFNSKYATLDAVIAATKKHLQKHGLAVTQLPAGNIVRTMLIHTSGQWISSDTPLHADKKGPQGYGSALTYGRRYALSSILNVASEADDDGHVAQHQKVIETSIPKQYEELSAKADTQEKWDKLGVWLLKNKASQKIMRRFTDEKAMFESGMAENEEMEAKFNDNKE